MKRILVRTICVGVFALSISSYSQAVLIDHGWYTTDTDTGLDWLDLTLTVGASYFDVTGNVAFHDIHAPSGWIAAGWEVASREQILGFWTNATGFTTGWDNGWSSDIYGATDIISSYVGMTWVQPIGGIGAFTPSFTRGYILSTCIVGGIGNFRQCAAELRLGSSWVPVEPSADGADWSSTTAVAAAVLEPSGDTGTWLIRSSPVPEPSTLALMAVGFVGLGFWRRKKWLNRRRCQLSS